MEGNILSRDDKCGRMLLYIKEPSTDYDKIGNYAKGKQVKVLLLTKYT